jgi:hypothetical protein
MNIYTGSEHWWLSKKGKGTRVSSHEESIKQIIKQYDLKLDITDGYDYMFNSGYARVIVNNSGIFVQTSFERLHIIRITREQKIWLEDKSFEKGFDGNVKNLHGDNVNNRFQLLESSKL